MTPPTESKRKLEESSTSSPLSPTPCSSSSSSQQTVESKRKRTTRGSNDDGDDGGGDVEKSESPPKQAVAAEHCESSAAKSSSPLSSAPSTPPASPPASPSSSSKREEEWTRRGSNDDDGDDDGDEEKSESSPEQAAAEQCTDLVNANAIKDIREMLQCPVCLEYPRAPPIYRCYNDHIICSACQVKVKTCPTCRDPRISVNRFAAKLAITVLRQVSAACRFSSHGCDKKDRVPLLSRHEEMCQFREIRCPASHRGVCKWVGSLAKLVTHARDGKCIQVRKNIIFASQIFPSICRNCRYGETSFHDFLFPKI